MESIWQKWILQASEVSMLKLRLYTSLIFLLWQKIYTVRQFFWGGGKGESKFKNLLFIFQILE